MQVETLNPRAEVEGSGLSRRIGEADAPTAREAEPSTGFADLLQTLARSPAPSRPPRGTRAGLEKGGAGSQDPRREPAPLGRSGGGAPRIDTPLPEAERLQEDGGAPMAEALAATEALPDGGWLDDAEEGAWQGIEGVLAEALSGFPWPAVESGRAEGAPEGFAWPPPAEAFPESGAFDPASFVREAVELSAELDRVAGSEPLRTLEPLAEAGMPVEAPAEEEAGRGADPPSIPSADVAPMQVGEAESPEGFDPGPSAERGAGTPPSPSPGLGSAPGGEGRAGAAAPTPASASEASPGERGPAAAGALEIEPRMDEEGGSGSIPRAVALDPPPAAEPEPVAVRGGIDPSDPAGREALARLVWSRIEAGGGRIGIRLQPPSLGTVDVEIAVRGGRVRIEFRVESPTARQIVASGLRGLESSLAERGLEVAGMHVSIGDREGDGGAPRWGAGGSSEDLGEEPAPAEGSAAADPVAVASGSVGGRLDFRA